MARFLNKLSMAGIIGSRRGRKYGCNPLSFPRNLREPRSKRFSQSLIVWIRASLFLAAAPSALLSGMVKRPAGTTDGNCSRNGSGLW